MYLRDDNLYASIQPSSISSTASLASQLEGIWSNSSTSTSLIKPQPPKPTNRLDLQRKPINLLFHFHLHVNTFGSVYGTVLSAWIQVKSHSTVGFFVVCVIWRLLELKLTIMNSCQGRFLRNMKKGMILASFWIRNFWTHPDLYFDSKFVILMLFPFIW